MHLCRRILVAGTRPPPYSWEKWNLKLLEPSNIRELQDDRTQSLKGTQVNHLLKTWKR